MPRGSVASIPCLRQPAPRASGIDPPSAPVPPEGVGTKGVPPVRSTRLRRVEQRAGQGRKSGSNELPAVAQKGVIVDSSPPCGFQKFGRKALRQNSCRLCENSNERAAIWKCGSIFGASRASHARRSAKVRLQRAIFRDFLSFHTVCLIYGDKARFPILPALGEDMGDVPREC